jgi:hypothetical protein
LRYARIGLQFKLWISDEEALIEPYHFGREDPSRINDPLCGFSQIHYTKTDREYKILSDHFDKLWKKSDPFWPEKQGQKNPWEIGDDLKNTINEKID